VGVWIALDEATVANGCMHVRPQGHLEGPRIHFQRRDWQICDTDIMGQPCVAVPLKPGGVLIFDGLLPHGTPTNHSGHRRKALQFHYVSVSADKAPQEERLKHFGSEGKNVECYFCLFSQSRVARFSFFTLFSIFFSSLGLR